MLEDLGNRQRSSVVVVVRLGNVERRLEGVLRALGAATGRARIDQNLGAQRPMRSAASNKASK